MNLRPSSFQRGFVLVAVVVVTMLVSMLAVSLMFRMRAEANAAAAGSASEQAWAVAMSGVHRAIQVVTESKPGSLAWQDAPEALRQQLVLDDGIEKWYFTVYTTGVPDGPPLRYGVTDEASKVHLNRADEAMLGKLPRMTPARVQALLDYLDADDTPRAEGAEQEYYSRLPAPYAIHNGPLRTLEELLLVRGFTRSLFYGEDANLNSQLDLNEDDEAERFPPDDGNGELDRGLRQYLTISSYDLNVDKQGAPRTNLNDPAADFSGSGLPQPVIAYLTGLQTNSVAITHPAELFEAKHNFKNDQGKEVEVASGVGEEELKILLDKYTATDDRQLPGLININTAGVQVLQTLPDVDLALAEGIVAARLDLDVAMRQSPVWLLQKRLVDAARFKRMAPYLTTRSYQFRFQVIGYALPSGRYRVLEAVVDLAPARASISYLRDLTRLGLPLNVNIETMDAHDQSRS